MMLMLSLGFGLGVLAVVLAGEYERRKKQPIVLSAASILAQSPRLRAEDARRRMHEIIDELAQDSTFTRFKVK